jgi:hypothetical protein
MKLLLSVVCATALALTTPVLWAASTTPPAKSPAPASAAAPQDPLPEAAPIQPPATLKIDGYLNELGAALKLSDEEKKAVASFYQADDAQLKNILNSDTLSPLEQDRQVNDLREARNAKIEELLSSRARIAAFRALEAKYRVGLLEIDMAPVVPAPAAPPIPTAAPAAAPSAPDSAKTPPPE